MDQRINVASLPFHAQLREWGRSRINGFHPLAPNMITIYSVIITMVGFWLYFQNWFAGLLVALFGGLLDIVDGRMARALGREILTPPRKWLIRDNLTWALVREDGVTELRVIGPKARRYLPKLWIELTYPGGTHLGQVWDPFADKVKSIPMMAVFAWMGYLNPWLVALNVLPEVIGTLMRRPFPLLAKWAHGSPASTWVGKTKVYVQWTAIIACVPLHQQFGWMTREWVYAPNALMFLAIILANSSVLSRWGKEKEEVSNG